MLHHHSLYRATEETRSTDRTRNVLQVNPPPPVLKKPGHTGHTVPASNASPHHRLPFTSNGAGPWERAAHGGVGTKKSVSSYNLPVKQGPTKSQASERRTEGRFYLPDVKNSLDGK